MSARISPLDLCDADKAERAMVWLYRTDTGMTLSLCAHHHKENECQLAILGFVMVEDHRAELEPKKIPAEIEA